MQQIAAVKGNVLHIPTVLGAVVVTYNLPAARQDSRSSSTAPTLADIFLGRITKWNDPRIAALNPGRQAARTRTSSSSTAPTARAPPSSSPTTCPRCRPSGRRRSGSATSVNWPIGLGGKGNEGVTQQVKQSEGAIGYVELIYAISNKLALRHDQERGRAVRRADAQERDARRRRAPSSSRTPTSGCRSPTPRALTPTRSRRSPGCWCQRQPGTRAKAQAAHATSCTGCSSPRPSGWPRISHYAPLAGAQVIELAAAEDSAAMTRRPIVVTESVTQP